MSQNVKEYHGHPNYTLIYGVLVALLALSFVSGLIEAPILAMTLLFGTAFIKAWLVIANFMHLKYEPWVIWLIPGSGVACLLTLYILVFPDAQLIAHLQKIYLLPY